MNALSDFRSSANLQVSSESSRRIVQSFLAVAFTISVVFWPVVWVLWAFLWRGGLSFRWLGLSLRRSDGRKAARWQCALRTFLVWAPLVALWTASLWLDFNYWAAWNVGDGQSWVPWLSSGLWWTGLMLLPVFALLTVLFPQRCLHDWLAGTYLVPR